MIDSESGAEAWIKPYDSDQRYQEYNILKHSQSFANGDHNCYFEARTGERPVVVVKLPADFDFQGCSHAQIKCRIAAPGYVDNFVTCRHIECSKTFDRQPSRTEPYTYNLDSVVGYSSQMKGYGNFGFVLEEGGSNESTRSLSERSLGTDLESHGKIIIETSLGRRGSKDYIPASWTIGASEIDEMAPIPKALAIDHGRSHVLRPEYLNNTRAPEWTTMFWPDKQKQPMTFKFYFVSRSFLQKQNLMAPSPPLLRKPKATSRSPRERQMPNITHRERRKSGQKRKYSEITNNTDSACDDEELLPKQRIKVETPVDDHGRRTTTTAFAVAATQAAAATSANDMTVGQAPTAKKVNNEVATTLGPTTNPPTQTEKARQKAKLMLRLEEIAIRKQLLELEE